MTGRSSRMEAARVPERSGRARLSSWRWLCVVAGLLCATGVLSGALRATEGGHHHGHPVAAVAVGATAHGSVLRGDTHAVAVGSAAAELPGYAAVAGAPRAEQVETRAVDSVRTRGPPAGA